VTVVADAGPLIALAKVGGLPVLFSLYPEILIPPAVHAEAVIAGEQRREPDATVLAQHCNAGELKVVPPSGELPLTPPFLGLGERQAIRLALERDADWLLVDDLDARRFAEETFRSAAVGTRIKGSLGVIVSARLAGHLALPEALRLVEALETRPDVWISRELCRRVATLLAAS
jgi:predicted nucleic acid-binding protein